MSQGTSNMVATTAIITSAAAAPANVMARGNFMGLMPAANYCSIVFSNTAVAFRRQCVRLTAAKVSHENPLST
jgi:cobalamin biosynthesis protein CbiG